MNYFKPISISLSPNVEKDDLRLSLNLLIRPWLWRAGKGIKELESEFAKYLGVKYAFSFNSGRSALYAILKAMELGGERPASAESYGEASVLLQAFTCNAVPNPILWAGLNPVYVDINRENFNVDINALKEEIRKLAESGTPPKLLVLQHTFGLPVNMDEVMELVRQNNLILIEDCAHALGAEYKMRKVGTFGKAAFFSFSRDKVISCIYGGMATTNDDELAKKLEALQKEFGVPSSCWTMQQLLHPVLLNYFILPVYNFLDLGKAFLVLSQITHVLSKAVSWQEKRGQKPDYFPKALPNALAALAYNQLHKIDRFYLHRKKLADYYRKELAGTKFVLPQDPENSKQSWLRFTVKHLDAHIIIYEAWHKQNILLGDWYTTAIAPFDTKLEEMKYKKGQCHNAEKMAQQTLNLPTHINVSDKDAERIVNFLKKWK